VSCDAVLIFTVSGAVAVLNIISFSVLVAHLLYSLFLLRRLLRIGIEH